MQYIFDWNSVCSPLTSFIIGTSALAYSLTCRALVPRNVEASKGKSKRRASKVLPSLNQKDSNCWCNLPLRLPSQSKVVLTRQYHQSRYFEVFSSSATWYRLKHRITPRKMTKTQLSIHLPIETVMSRPVLLLYQIKDKIKEIYVPRGTGLFWVLLMVILSISASNHILIELDPPADNAVHYSN